MDRETETTAEYMSKLLSFTLIAHKYGFSNIEKFGYRLIVKHCVDYQYTRSPICTALHYRNILQLCFLMGDSANSTRDYLVLDILSLVSDQLDHEGDPVEFLNIAQDYDIREIQGVVYYRILKTAVLKSFIENNGMNFLPHAPPDLTDTQKKNLQTGFISMLGVSEQLKMDGWEALIDRTSCNCEDPFSDKQTCRQARLAVMSFADKEARTRTFSFDILGHLELMKDQSIHRNYPFYSNAPARCQSVLLSDIAKEEKKCKSVLADYFLGSLQEKVK
jgi:hypothetical protein